MHFQLLTLIFIFAVATPCLGQDAYLYEGIEYLNQGKTKKAKRLIGKSQINTDSTVVETYNLAHFQMRAGLYQQSNETYRYILKNDTLSSSSIIHFNMGTNYFILHEYDSAIIAFQRELKDNNKVYLISPGRKPMIYERIAFSYAGLNELDSTVRYFEEVLALDSTNLESIYLLTMFYRKNNQLDKALATVDIGIQQQPQAPYFLALRANLLLDLNDNTAALDYFEKAIKAGYDPSRKEKKIIRLLKKERKLNSLIEATEN